MRVFIPSAGRPDGVKTHQLRVIEGLDWHVVVHTTHEKEHYARSLERDRILVSNTSPGKSRQMEYVVKQVAQPGEWVIFADDDIRKFTGVIYGAYNRPYLGDQSLFKHEIVDPIWFEHVLEDTRAEADLHRAHLAGFAVYDNPFWRARKFRTIAKVAGRFMLWKADPSYPFDHSFNRDDLRDTAEHLYRDGAVVVNNYLYADAEYLTPGGHGTLADGRAQKFAEDAMRLMEEYPELFRIKPDAGAGVDLNLRLSSSKQLQRWRNLMDLERGV